MSSRIDRDLLKRAIRENIETLCRHFFPNGKKALDEWQVGNLQGEAGRTLNIHLEGDKAGIFQDFNTGEHGDFVMAIKIARGLGFVEAALEIGRAIGINLESGNNTAAGSGNGRRTSGSRYTTGASIKPPDWKKDYALADSDLKELAAWRGYSISFCSWLNDHQLIGRQNGLWAFPVYHDGVIVSVHVRHDKNKWIYRPRLKDIGVALNPLVIGDLDSAQKVFSGESQWDLFSVLERLGIHHGEAIAGIATRGAQNGSLVGTLEIKAELYLLPQNDEAGRAWLEHAAGVLSCTMRILSVPSIYHDVDDWLRAIKDIAEFIEAIRNAQIQTQRPRPAYIEFHKPSYFINYQPPDDLVLVGDNHIVRGSVFVIGGAPGVGKSRASVSLALAGALVTPWFNLEVLTEFRTMILQAENGRFRLKEEFSEINQPSLEDHLLICPPPPHGLCFNKTEFKDQLKAANDEFGPHLVLLDPWNAVAHDDRLRDYRESFDVVAEVFDLGTEKGPGIGILAHTRKPLPGERANGRALLNLLAGSYVLGSVPRCVFVMQSASDDVNETKVIWTCCKNNDGKLGPRSVWERKNGLFVPVQNFDWTSFDSPEEKKDKPIDETALAEIFNDGALKLKRADAVEALINLTGRKRSTCYDALNEKTGRLKRWLKLEGGLLAYVP
jgi:hypothetical protein